MAWATADVLSPDDAEDRLAAHAGQFWRPSEEAATDGIPLRCPMPGTLQSLLDRHADQRRRIVGGVFRKPREARFRLVSYNCPPDRLLLELRPALDEGRRFQPWPLAGAADLTTTVRDAAKHRLLAAGVAPALVARYLVGRGAVDQDKGRRLRIIPLPSIGHPHADSAIRRILVERPPECPIPADVLHHAVSNLDLAAPDPKTGEVLASQAPVLAPAEDDIMVRHYGIAAPRLGRVWSSVTPVALPVYRQRGTTGGVARAHAETGAAYAVRQALRHAGVTHPVESIRVQREPFWGRGARAEAFAASRFPAACLWHVRLAFSIPIEGPLVIGNGRYIGLGLMRPETDVRRDALMLTIVETDRPPVEDRATVVLALRRALMSLARDAEGRVPTLFSGHADGPGPAASGQHRHVYLFADDSDGDGLLDRLGVVTPWIVDRSITARSGERARFEEVVSGLHFLRLPDSRCLRLLPPCAPPSDDPLFCRATLWTSHTPYRPTRHGNKGADLTQLVRTDLHTECVRRGLPKPEIEVEHLEAGPRGGLQARARLVFAVTTPGPILLGRDAHRGGGQFAASPA